MSSEPVHQESYTWLRLAIVGLLVLIAASVVVQTVSQGRVLESVSAYYYTPAQGIFVGGLIGLAACTLALKGDPPAENTALDLAGMFAAIVAVVPTGRPADLQSVRLACLDAGSPLLTERALSTGLVCPTTTALEEATTANVANNLTALLVVGCVVLFVGGIARWKGGEPFEGGAMSFVLPGIVWILAAIARVFALDWAVRSAHFIAAAALGLSVLSVAVINARRLRPDQGRHEDDEASAPEGLGRRLRGIAEEGSWLASGIQDRNQYVWLARIAVVAAAVSGVLVALGIMSVFWLELVVAVLFAAFWSVQTCEFASCTWSREAVDRDEPSSVGSPSR